MYTRIFSKYDKKQGLHYLYLNGTAIIEDNGRILAIANIYNWTSCVLDYDLIVTTQFSNTFSVEILVKKIKTFLAKACKWTESDARRKKYTLHVVDGHLPEVKLDFFKDLGLTYEY